MPTLIVAWVWVWESCPGDTHIVNQLWKLLSPSFLVYHVWFLYYRLTAQDKHALIFVGEVASSRIMYALSSYPHSI